MAIGAIEMRTFKDRLQEDMQNPEFRAEYEALEPEFALIEARSKAGLTQQELADKTGISQPDISKLESGNANPSLNTLRRLADAMGMRVKVEFEPIAK